MQLIIQVYYILALPVKISSELSVLFRIIADLTDKTQLLTLNLSQESLWF